jgi:hypothetical protein
MSNMKKLGLLILLALISTAFLKPTGVKAVSDSLSLAPSTQSVNKGSTFSVTIHEDSGTDAINGVQANLSYPTSLLKLVSATAASGWSIAQNDTSTPGTTLFGAFPSPPGATLTGDNAVETVVFQALAPGTANITFGCSQSSGSCPNGNAITRASDNADILATTSGATITVNPSGASSSVVIVSNGSSTSRIVARIGGTILAKDGLYDAWVTEATGLSTPVQIYAAGNRIGYLDSSKNFYVKQGLYGTWVKENVSVDDAVLTPTRMAVRIGGTILAKDGLFDGWTTEITGLGTPVQIYVAGERLAYLDSSKNLFVKQGLYGTWVKENVSVDDAVFTSTRMLVRIGGSVIAKDGLYDAWATEITGLGSPTQIIAAGDRIAFLDPSGNLYVKQGLSGSWVKENVSVNDVVFTPSRMLIRIGGTILAKDGLYDAWVTEITGVTTPAQLFAAGDRISYLDNAKNFFVKQSLYGTWIKENVSVDDALLTG